MNYEIILNQVLKKIKPTKNEELAINKKNSEFISKLKINNAKIIIGGSTAKGTWIKDKYDVDIFVQFDYEKFKDEDISKILGEALKKFKPTKLHGSRDYYQVKDDIIYEIVPVLEINKSADAKNITDISPLHSIWVRNNSDEKLRDEIRLAKYFFKANNLYGAESYIKGFSGYVIEILTIYYGSFIKLLQGLSKLKEGAVIDIMKHHKDIFFEINASKLVSPIFVIDPVQKGRNASAALSIDKFNYAKKISKEFIKKPNISFFEDKTLNLNEELENKNAIILKIIPYDGKKDIVGCKIEKVFKYFKRLLLNNDFEIISSEWEWKDDAIIIIRLKEIILKEIKIIKGPNVKFEKGCEQFKLKYPESYVENDFYTAKIKRKFIDAKELIQAHKQDKYILERIKEVELYYE